jgi:hypothetical protein
MDLPPGCPQVADSLCYGCSTGTGSVIDLHWRNCAASGGESRGSSSCGNGDETRQMTFFHAEMTVKFQKVGFSPDDLPRMGNFSLTRKHFKQFRSD